MAAGHGITMNKNKIWVDTYNGARHGSSGRGTAVASSPTDSGDPYLSALSGLKCSSAHHTVRLAMYVMTESRAKLLAGPLQKRYLSQWSKMASARTSCPTKATPDGLEYRGDAQAGIE